MDIPDALEPFRRFASSCANVRVTAGGVTLHWLDWYLRIWEDRGTTFAASTRRGSEPIAECYGSEELVWKWALTRIGAYTRYCMRYPAITPPHTSEAPPTGVHLTGHGINLDIAPGIPAFLNTDLDTLVTAYMSPTGGPLHDLTDFKTWETDPMGKGFFPNLAALVNMQKENTGRQALADVCAFALDEYNIPQVTKHLYANGPETKTYLWFDGENYVCGTSSRGGPCRTEFAAPDFTVFIRLLIMEQGWISRYYREFAPITIPSKADQLAQGWDIVDDNDNDFYGLTTPEGVYISATTQPYRRARLANTTHLSPEELLNAFLDPWGGMLHQYLDREHWERFMRPSLRGMRSYSDYDLSSYDAFIASHPWYTS
ncbi:hypothetical protein [Schaalia sp. Marseille-Q2122]|uniref:hypothetical protein n=1 Tax=Schaalia sp. Marseille-Q2122 TaxID=2736604 RepID=UPI00158DB995|nr:hypothetical protein [Schaalia sp. Marseille-Q2122]